MMLKCFDVAIYILAQVNEDIGDIISNLKLQKLVYYSQGFHLALHNTPLFREQIKAWPHGPVVPTLYHEYKDAGAGVIEPPEEIDFSIYSKEQRELMDEIYSLFGQFSAWKLRNMTHEEPPWKDAFEKGHGSLITNNALKSYFKTQLINN